ncbi:MAG: hypothetical protein OEV24_20520, partial [Cyclobacteriaceae bacterium]|nr:hypothetical protein [Cyclobacteriaceae bacterium]
ISVKELHFRIKNQLVMHGLQHLFAPRIEPCALRKPNLVFYVILPVLAGRKQDQQKIETPNLNFYFHTFFNRLRWSANSE